MLTELAGVTATLLCVLLEMFVMTVAVTVLLKTSKKQDPGNYRLVSLNSLPGKVLEQIFLETISCLSRSCLTNLIVLCGEVTGSCGHEEGNGCCASSF